MRKFSMLLSLGLLAAVAHPLFADPIVGSTVNGTLNFNGNNAPNYFRVLLGGSGISSTIGPGLEFTYTDAANTDTVNFSANGVVIRDILGAGQTAGPFKMTFQDAAFTGFSLASADAGFTFSFSGDTLTVNFAGASAAGNYSTTLAYAAATPEPSSLLLLGTGLIGVAGAARRRFFA